MKNLKNDQNEKSIASNHIQFQQNEKMKNEKSQKWLSKTTDFQMLQSISIVPSSQRWLSSCENNFKKWWFGDEEGTKEVSKFCRIMWVQPKFINMSLFQLNFWYVIKQVQMYVMKPKILKKVQYSWSCACFRYHRKNSYYHSLSILQLAFMVSVCLKQVIFWFFQLYNITFNYPW